MDKDVSELLSRGVGEFIDPEGAFKKKLLTNPEKVVIKFGIDPTRPDIHLGHAFIFRKLKKFQDLGCKIIFLLGDFTAQIGDPTGKSKVRPEMSMQEIYSNAMTYLQQNGKILNISDPKKYAVLLNTLWFRGISDVLPSKFPTPEEQLGQWKKEIDKWVDKIPGINKEFRVTISLLDFLRVLRKITQAQLIERDMFQERIKGGEELYMHEMMYPVLQGIDSYAIAKYFGSCDLEVGGTDQTFNMLMGRTVMKIHEGAPQAVLSFKLLEGTEGKEKMSKSLDNFISINEIPNEMYGKVMSIPDSSLKNYFELTTDVPMIEVEEILNNHPKEAKMRLAFEITKIYHGEEAARKAEENFEEAFSKGGVPKDIKTVTAEPDEPLVDILLREGLVSYKTEFNRLNKEGAIKEIESGVYRVGKHRFLKIVRSD